MLIMTLGSVIISIYGQMLPLVILALWSQITFTDHRESQTTFELCTQRTDLDTKETSSPRTEGTSFFALSFKTRRKKIVGKS